MKLFAALIWYEESPTWLAACVSSLATIGVDHLVAVDGAYLHFPHGEPRSGVEQGEAISLAAHQVGIGTTIVRPQEVCWTEPEKRAASFRHVQALATPMRDWFIVIDADEVIKEGTPGVKHELAALPDDTHAAQGRLFQALDPFAEPGTANVNRKTSEIYQKFDLPNHIRSLQSRFFRVLYQLDCGATHWAYKGVDADGRGVNLRPDLASKWDTEGLTKTEVAALTSAPTIEHRDPWRTQHRRANKKAYYELRDELGLERV